MTLIAVLKLENRRVYRNRKLERLQERGLRAVFKDNNSSYYMEESVLLGTKPLVDSIRHFIRDPSGVFSVCHPCECRIVK